jgi:NAD(P)-dependent dehydrogenase (short-subunit alcohol dehydrogenase family)
MSAATVASPTPREPDLLGRTVVVIGASARIGLATARQARAEGADVIISARTRPAAAGSGPTAARLERVPWYAGDSEPRADSPRAGQGRVREGAC